MPPRYTEHEARAAIAASLSYTEALRRLGMRPAGGNHRTIRRYAEQVWKISTTHFDPNRARGSVQRAHAIPLAEVRALGYLATGHRYGVSDTAIRKWLREYERKTEPSSGPRVRAPP